MEVNVLLHALTALSQRKSAHTHWIGGWVGPRAGLDGVNNELVRMWKEVKYKYMEGSVDRVY
jgi:hypothetical protein